MYANMAYQPSYGFILLNSDVLFITSKYQIVIQVIYVLLVFFSRDSNFLIE